eukprot:COSAG02_NODE_26670_length_627_cov_6.011364_1_plen_83_part_01
MPGVKSTYVSIMPYHYRALCPPYLGVAQGIRPYALCHTIADLRRRMARRSNTTKDPTYRLRKAMGLTVHPDSGTSWVGFCRTV